MMEEKIQKENNSDRSPQANTTKARSHSPLIHPKRIAATSQRDSMQ
jgi:hypothetical protein